MALNQFQKFAILGATMVIAGGGAYYFTEPPEGMPACYKKLVCDNVNIFTAQQSSQLAEYHKALLESYDIDMRVFSVQNLSPQTAVAIFKAAQIGENSKTRKGLLLAVDPNMDVVRLEVSAGLDAVYTDGFVAYIQQRQMVPFFQANQVANGILATTEMLVTRAQEAIAGKQFIAPEQLPQNLAIGAGAQTKASIGSGYKAPQASGMGKVKEGLSPEEVVALYHKALADGNTAYDLPIYAVSTQEMKKEWVVTPAQMKNELEAYKKCDIDKTIILKEKSLAVVRYKVEQRQCAPYFLRLEDRQWRLDFLTMMYNVKFNVSNEWHLDTKKPLQYVDAFLDWSFNKDGYPFPMPKLRWGIVVNTDLRNKVTTIYKIEPNSPAANMNLREKDVVLSWDGIENPNNKQIGDSMYYLPDGKIIKVRIMRDGTELNLELKTPPKN